MAAMAVFPVPCTSSYGETSTNTASCSRRVRNVVQLPTRRPKPSAEFTRLLANFNDLCNHRIAHVHPCGSVIAHVRSGRSVMYDEPENYVLMEPGEDEQFVTAEELQAKLKTCLQQWQGKQLPPDLARFKTVEEAVEYLMTSVCELELGDGQGSVQWYEVRLD